MSVFLDTNVLLYSLDLNVGEGTKRHVALGYLARRDVVLSVQVLQEFYVQATHARRARPLSHDNAVGLIRAWSRFDVIDNTQALLKAGLALRASAQLSLWDALVVAAAAGAGCEELITEDLNPGQTIAGVRITNPFHRGAT
ncbi:MAG: PIN domain-containing protein [Phenylobacterium sp.]|uniref:PIN domain-containing protein n=1 Tax=Phenylobacterium sp. TaxID=1871053 RepID=UPI0025EE90AF|nr:PIN domain-containing protein [Phenylobacterium sp.]MCG9917506.1 PIN domain-containing protein [Phenylobacterium sp.]